jgi:hypothetical protein
VRYIKKKIDTPFIHNSVNPVKECSNKRPDIYYELNRHCVIVEIDENQHKSYEEICECARLNQIVSSIGGKSVIFIRYNPDKTKHKNKQVLLSKEHKLKILIDTIKNELNKDYDKFNVKLVQLFYDDNNEKYNELKEMNVTNILAC